MQGSFSIGRLPPARVLHQGTWWYFTGHMDTCAWPGRHHEDREAVAEYEADREPAARIKRWFDYDGNMAMEVDYDNDFVMVPYGTMEERNG